ncbi:MAG: DHA2 family efflux MFS transporter permease subunit [Candidatus Buchananbacteria bacterium]
MALAKNKTKKDHTWLILLTVIIGTFLGRLDQTIVGLATPDIIDDFGITVSAAGWISTAYIIANAIFVPIWGKLGDTIGRKKIYIAGFVVFIIGSVLSGLSWNLSSMIVFRIIQAIAGSADYPTAMAIIAVTFRDPAKRAQALGLWSASFAAAAVFGPLIGGPLVDNFGWPSIFLLNLPVGLVGLVMAIMFIHESKSEAKNVSFDWWGSITLGVSLAAMVLVLEKGFDWGWTSANSLLCYFATVFFLFVFILIEQKIKEPIVDLKFFKIKSFNYTILNNFLLFMGMMSVIFPISIFAQTYLGLNATQTGFLYMPMAFFMMLGAPIGGSFSNKVEPRYVIMVSSFIAAIGLFMFTGLDARSTSIDIIIPICVMAFGMGLGMAERTNIITATVPTEEVGSASSVLALARNISGAFGIAVFTTILNTSTENNVLSIAQSSRLNVLSQQSYAEFVSLITLKAQINAYHDVFMIGGGLLLLATVTSLLIIVPKGKKLEKVVVE